MAAFNKFEDFINQLGQGTHLLHAAGHELDVYLSNATPSASLDNIKTDLAEITTGNGYSGPVDTQQDYTETAGTGSCTAGVDITWTASGGAINQFQYVVLFNQTAASDNLIGWWPLAAAVDLADGESFTIDFEGDDTAGGDMFTIA